MLFSSPCCRPPHHISSACTFPHHPQQYKKQRTTTKYARPGVHPGVAPSRQTLAVSHLDARVMQQTGKDMHHYHICCNAIPGWTA
eukprot:355368-Chlamydomonas_euryale.AAC.21